MMGPNQKAFEASLTQEEIDAPTFMEWSDETLGRAARAVAKDLDADGNVGAHVYASAAMLAVMAKHLNADQLDTSVAGYRVLVAREPEA